MKRPLSGEEAALWRRVAETVTPLRGRKPLPRGEGGRTKEAQATDRAAPAPQPSRATLRQPPGASPPPKREERPLGGQTLDSTWDRKLARGTLSPDFTLDLHGHSLDAAHLRLDHGLAQAMALGARVVLLVTGRARPHDDHASRGERRGAIRAKFADWLAHGPHASKIAAIRPAHPRHGGAGAVYIVLKRPR